MPREAAITYEDVARACVRLIGRAKHPSVDAVYEEVGRRGSKSTIHKHQKAFLEKFQSQGMSMLPAALPEALLPAIEEFWGEARLMAGNVYQEKEAEWERELAAMRETLEAQTQLVAQRDRELEQSRRDIESVHREKDTAEETIADLKSKQRALTGVVDTLRNDKERLRDQIESERKDAQARHDQTVEDHLAEREMLKDALNSLKQQRAEDNHKQEKLTDYWAMQVADARDQVSAAREEVRQVKSSYSHSLHVEKEKVASLSVRVDKLLDALEESRTNHMQETADLQKKLEEHLTNHMMETKELRKSLETSKTNEQNMATKLTALDDQYRELKDQK
jgi:chromosome segregation ATPase